MPQSSAFAGTLQPGSSCALFSIFVDMSDPPPGNQSKKSRLRRPFKSLLSRRSRSPSHQGAQLEIPHNTSASLSARATSAPQGNPIPEYTQNVDISTMPSISASPTNNATSASQVSPQGTEYTSTLGLSTMPSISASSTNSVASAPQANPQGTEFTSILGLSTTPSGPLTWDHRMKEWGSTAYEGLKIVIQGIYDCSNIFPPLQTTAGVLLTISKAVDVRESLCSTC